MEAGKSQICQNGVPVGVWRLEVAMERKEELGLPLEGRPAGELCLSHRRLSILSSQVFHRLDDGAQARYESVYGRLIFSIYQLRVSLDPKYPHRQTCNHLWVSGHPVAQSSCHIKLTTMDSLSVKVQNTNHKGTYLKQRETEDIWPTKERDSGLQGLLQRP